MNFSQLSWIFGIVASSGAIGLLVSNNFSPREKSYSKSQVVGNKPVIGGRYSWKLTKNENNNDYQIVGLRYHGPKNSNLEEQLWLNANGVEELEQLWVGDQCKDVKKNESESINKALSEALSLRKGSDKCSKELNKALLEGIKSKKWAWYYNFGESEKNNKT